MRDFDNRIKSLREAIKGFSLVTLHYKDGTTRMVKPPEAIRQIMQSRENSVVKISGGEDASGRFNEVLQAVIDSDIDEP